MRLYIDILEQMDLSLDHIAAGDPLYDRFAIMLIDNCMELFLHRFALDYRRKFNMQHFLGKIQPDDDKVARNATGQIFNDKVTLAVREGILSPRIGESVRLLHEYRNTSYHAGLKHEGILNGMAKLYFYSLAQLLSEYRPKTWGSNPSDVPSVRVLRYVGSSNACHSPDFLGVFSRLMLTIDSMGQTLKDDLFKSAESMIEECNAGIEFILKNAPSDSGLQTRASVVLDAEVWPIWSSEKAIELLKKSGLTNPTMNNCIKWLSKNYPGLCRTDPIPSWKKRINAIRLTSCHHEALSKYYNFVNQTESIRTNILGSVGALEYEIDRQIDER